MSLWGNFYDPDPSFTPLFRLLDEFDNYTRESRGNSNGRSRNRGRQQVSVFHPRFDIKETETAYELHGELPGIERDKINIEFTDPQTLVIRGRTERSYSSGTFPAAFVENSNQPAGVITEKGEKHANESNNNNDDAEQSNNNGAGGKANKAPFEKYWVQERSVGEFARTFNFPSRIDQDAVSASLNNGILSLIVPKAKKHEARRIAIN
ncbi:heat shock protein 30 [Parathielavia appendiculata]|uniref:Heat shock protein 30 n=1 Tax=Parathielavia appendiculata TaxID=2587402 RepID=A0AAN6U8A1_9PEZI|nr:heat shock protein 30 [Parathielavia appendiculata]